MNLGS